MLSISTPNMLKLHLLSIVCDHQHHTRERCHYVYKVQQATLIKRVRAGGWENLGDRTSTLTQKVLQAQSLLIREGNLVNPQDNSAYDKSCSRIPSCRLYFLCERAAQFCATVPGKMFWLCRLPFVQIWKRAVWHRANLDKETLLGSLNSARCKCKCIWPVQSYFLDVFLPFPIL